MGSFSQSQSVNSTPAIQTTATASRMGTALGSFPGFRPFQRNQTSATTMPKRGKTLPKVKRALSFQITELLRSRQSRFPPGKGLRPRRRAQAAITANTASHARYGFSCARGRMASRGLPRSRSSSS